MRASLIPAFFLGLAGLTPLAWAGSEQCRDHSRQPQGGELCLVQSEPDADGRVGLRLELRPAEGEPLALEVALEPGLRLDPGEHALVDVELGAETLVWVALKRRRPGAGPEEAAPEDECVSRFFRLDHVGRRWEQLPDRWACRRPCSMQFVSYQTTQPPQGERSTQVFHECTIDGQYLKSTYAWEGGKLRPLEIAEPRSRDALARGHAAPPFVPVCQRSAPVRDELVRRLGQGCEALGPDALLRVTRLDLSGKGIARLQVGDFSGLDELISLDLMNNPLAELPAGLFDGLFKLHSLCFQGCRLRSLPAGLFRHLGSLKDLYLNHNRLESLAPGAFEGLGSLGFLTLDHNLLRELPAGVFDPLPKACHVYRSGNPLKD